jgi:hypothetical protein
MVARGVKMVISRMISGAAQVPIKGSVGRAGFVPAST